MKVLHVLSSLNAGGIEKWLCDLTIANSISGSLQLTYCINSKQDSSDFFEDKIRAYGGEIIRIAAPSDGRVNYIRSLFHIMKREKFDVVHSHSFFFSGLVLAIAYFAGVPGRIAHSHNNKDSVSKYKTAIGSLYATTMRLCLGVFANQRLAVSSEAGNFLYGSHSYMLVPCGIDFSIDRSSMEALELPIDEDAYLTLAHVGSFTEQKNHEFIAEIAKRLIDKGQGKRVLFLFIGDGPLRPLVEKKFSALNSRALFLGVRPDVKEILSKYADVFLFPSKFEGLGLVALEAQSQGLFCLLSDNVPTSVIVLDDVVTLGVKPGDSAQWADLISSLDKEQMRARKKTRAELASEILENSQYSVIRSLDALTNIYIGIV